MQRFIAVNDLELNVFDQGSGEAILFIHGFPLDHTMWTAQLEEFTATHRVIAPDLRGFGRSEDSAGAVLMEQFADDLAGVLEALEIHEPVNVCGLSMGGYITWQFWKRHPAKVKRLLLCDTRAAADPPDVRRGRFETAEKVLTEGPEVLAQSMPPRLYAPQTRQLRPELIEEAQRIIMHNSPAGIAAALRGMANRPDVTSWLPEINVPTLLIVGAEDAITPPDEMAAMAAAIPQAQLQKIPHAGHMSPQEQPQLVNQALRQFLSQ